MGSLLANASVSQAFSNTARAPSTKSSKLAFHPARLEQEFDYRMPAESFTFTRYAKTELSSEYVQSKWDGLPSPKRLSYLDVISSTANGSKGLDQKQNDRGLEDPEEPLEQAHRIQQAYREWCEVSSRMDNGWMNHHTTRFSTFLYFFVLVLWKSPKQGTPRYLCHKLSCGARVSRTNLPSIGSERICRFDGRRIQTRSATHPTQ